MSSRVLNRTTLRRQLLLEHTDLPVVAATEQMLGLNAQSPNPPYLALWSRLRHFEIDDLTTAIEDRRLVRSTMMRATQHLVSAADFRLIRPALVPLLQRVQRNAFGQRTAGIDLDALVAEARQVLADGTVLTRPELGRQLARRRPGADPNALGWTVQYLEPMVHPAPSGTWNTYGATPFVLATEWLGDAGTDIGRDVSDADTRQIVRRYLGAFGPASVADARAWSGVSGLRDVFEQMRSELRVYSDEAGRELFDLPEAPIIAGDVPAPVRFLPEFDAPLLAYADRTRMMTDDVRRQVCIGAGVAATVLVDGTVAATWTSSCDDDAVLTVRPLRRLSGADRAAVHEEGMRLLTFVAPTADSYAVHILAPHPD